MKIKFTKLLFLYVILILGYFSLLAYPYLSSKITRFSSLGFLSLVEEKSEDIRKVGKDGEHLLKGEKITGKLHATENDLGIVLVRFAQLSAKVTDTVTFRIKEEGKENWYYENNYRANQFQSNEYFTFGFPPISDSKGKVYVFEVESLEGTVKNGIGLSPKEPQTALVYRFTKDNLKNFNSLSSFISKKLIYTTRKSISIMDWQVLTIITIPFLFVYFMREKKFRLSDSVKFLKVPPPIIQNMRYNNSLIIPKIIRKMKSSYLSTKKKVIKLSKKIVKDFLSSKFYLTFLNTDTKKRIAIGLLIFLFAFLYRLSATLIDQLGVSLFYAGLGGQGDYDQFIRAATCAVRDFYSCPLVLHQNLLIESSILGTFYEIFGFVGGLKAYLYLMIIASSIVATLPYLLLAHKKWLSIGGIMGGLYLATSDFLTQVALNYPPDNGSLFTFSMFFVVYLATIHMGTIRWLLFFGLVGFIDGMYKALFLISDLVALSLFVPAFFYEKARGRSKILFHKKNIRILFFSIIPLLVFIVLYSIWEYIVHVKFGAVYFLRGVIESGGSAFVSYTVANETSSKENILLALFNLSISPIIMVKRLIEFSQIGVIFLAPIFLSLLLVTFKAPRFPVRKFVTTLIFSAVLFMMLTLIKNNYLGIHEIFRGDYIPSNWTQQTYIGVFLFYQVIFLFILNFRYSAIKLSLPIIPYVIMLIVLTQNSYFPRLWVHVIAWTIVLFAFLIDFIFSESIRKKSIRSVSIWAPIVLLLFIGVYMSLKTGIMVSNFNSGNNMYRDEVKYLRWVNENLPENAVVLAGGKSDLVKVAQNIKRPVIYNTSWVTAVLIEPNKIPGISPTDFSLVNELQNKESFKENMYFILEEDIDLWRNRIQGVADGVFSASPSAGTLSAEDYSINVYKSNPTLKKTIYELNHK